jgi:tetratricopeptide (TPR) repeat protein
MDPWDELANRRLMLVLLQEGQRNAALRHYAAYREELARELGCEPEEETRALYAQIRDGTLLAGGRGDTPALAGRPWETRRRGDAELPWVGGRGESAAPALAVPVSPPLPVSASRFVAREQEMARLSALLDRAMTGQGGVALISGEAGAGKTALLDEFARRASQTHGALIVLSGSCNAHAGAPYLPFREMLQTLAGDVEGKRAGGTLSLEQARRAWEALPAVGAALVEHGPDLIDTFVPGEALLRRIEGFPVPRLSRARSRDLPKGPGPPGAAHPLGRGPSGQVWLLQLREVVRRAREVAAPSAGASAPVPDPSQGLAPHPDLFAQVTQVLHTVSTAWPLLLVVDDLQWTGAGTAALLFHLGRRLEGSRILLACAYRPEALQDPADLKGVPLGTVLHELVRKWGDVLIDLDRADGRAFVEAYVDSEPNRLRAAFRQALYDHTEGNPLFTVELLRGFERQGALVWDEAGHWIEAPGLDWDDVPARVEAVIAGHLAGLPEEDRALLQVASIQGELFVAEIAARVLGRGEKDVVERLSGLLRTQHRLVEADRLERLAASGERLSFYRFRHSLVQRSAYASLDAVARARLHEATGRTLEAIYAGEERAPSGASGQAPALAVSLAWHFEAAGRGMPAARALHDAGREAMALSAQREALNHFDHGLALLAGEPPSKERAELQRQLGLARLGPQRNLAGMGASEVESAFAQATEGGAGDAHGRPALQMLQAQLEFLTSKGLLEEALAAAERLLDQATNQGDEAFVAIAHYMMAMPYNFMGRLHEAESHFQWLLAWFTPERRAELRAIFGFDFLNHTLMWVALDHWFLGYPEQALRYSHQALAVAVEQEDWYGQGVTSAIGSNTLFLLRSDAAALQERAELCHRLCLERGYLWWQAFSEVFLGWLAVKRGEDAGIKQMQSAIAAWQGTGMLIGTDNLSLVLADGCLAAAGAAAAGADAARAPLLDTGLAAIDTVLGPSRLPCGDNYQAELHRVRGELLLARDGLPAAGEALACFERAMQIGAEQGALAWELRAAMSLVRLRQRQGETCAAELAEARQRLREVYERFAEGFAFPDLQDAAALIGNHLRQGISETQ